MSLVVELSEAQGSRRILAAEVIQNETAGARRVELVATMVVADIGTAARHAKGHVTASRGGHAPRQVDIVAAAIG